MKYLKKIDDTNRLIFDILDENKNKIGNIEFRSHGTVLYNIDIDEKNRKVGYGSRALQEAFNIMKKRGVKEVSVQATGDSVNFYETNGFVSTGERDGPTEYLFIRLK